MSVGNGKSYDYKNRLESDCDHVLGFMCYDKEDLLSHGVKETQTDLRGKVGSAHIF